MDRDRDLRSTWQLQKNKSWQSHENDAWNVFALTQPTTDTDLTTYGTRVDRGKMTISTETEMALWSYVTEHLRRPFVLAEETEMSVAIFVSTTNFYDMLMYYLPWYDKINPTFKALCAALDVYFRYLEEQKARIDRNLDLDSAIEILPQWELRLGIEVNTHLSYEQRRRQIYAVKMLAHRQVTKETIALLCRAFGNNDEAAVEVYPHESEPYTFVIEFTSGGLPNNLTGLESVLRRSMPADLSWKFAHKQSPWGSIKRYRWGDVKDKTWKDINTYKEGSTG